MRGIIPNSCGDIIANLALPSSHGPRLGVCHRAGHQNTQAPIRAVPAPDPARKTMREAVSGNLPSTSIRPAAAPFAHPLPEGQVHLFNLAAAWDAACGPLGSLPFRHYGPGP
jgi:hypothetical protein